MKEVESEETEGDGRMKSALSAVLVRPWSTPLLGLGVRPWIEKARQKQGWPDADASEDGADAREPSMRSSNRSMGWRDSSRAREVMTQLDSLKVPGTLPSFRLVGQ